LLHNVKHTVLLEREQKRAYLYYYSILFCWIFYVSYRWQKWLKDDSDTRYGNQHNGESILECDTIAKGGEIQEDRQKAIENLVVWKPTDRPRWDYPYFSLPNAFNLLYFIRADPFDRIFIWERNA